MASPLAPSPLTRAMGRPRIWDVYTYRDLQNDSQFRYGAWDENRIISFRHTPPTEELEPRESQFYNPKAHIRFAGKTVAHPAQIPTREPFPTPSNAWFPDWLMWEDADQFLSQFNSAFRGPNEHRQWEDMGYRQARTVLSDYYNLQGRIQSKQWIARDEIAAATVIMARGLKAKRRITVVPLCWESCSDDNWEPELVMPTQEICNAIRREADLVVFPLFSAQHRHFMGMIMDQRDGMVYWYDPMWSGGHSEALFVNDIRALRKFYYELNAPMHIAQLINASACVVDAVQQTGGWECGLYVAEWFRSALRSGSLCPTSTNEWDVEESQNLDYGERVRRQWIGWISAEFHVSGRHQHGAMRPVPKGTLEEACHRHDQLKRSQKKQSQSPASVIYDPINLEDSDRTPTQRSEDRLSTPQPLNLPKHGYQDKPSSLDRKNDVMMSRLQSEVAWLRKDMDTKSPPRTPLNRRQKQLLAQEDHIVRPSPPAEAPATPSSKLSHSLSGLSIPGDTPSRHRSPKKIRRVEVDEYTSPKPPVPGVWEGWTKVRDSLPSSERRAWEAREADRVRCAQRHKDILKRRRNTYYNQKKGILEYRRHEWVDRFDDPIAEAAFTTQAYAPWFPPGWAEGWEGWKRWNAGEEWDKANDGDAEDDEDEEGN